MITNLKFRLLGNKLNIKIDMCIRFIIKRFIFDWSMNTIVIFMNKFKKFIDTLIYLSNLLFDIPIHFSANTDFLKLFVKISKTVL